IHGLSTFVSNLVVLSTFVFSCPRLPFSTLFLFSFFVQPSLIPVGLAYGVRRRQPRAHAAACAQASVPGPDLLDGRHSDVSGEDRPGPASQRGPRLRGDDAGTDSGGDFDCDRRVVSGTSFTARQATRCLNYSVIAAPT